jgi:hypothetical protein
MPTSLPAESYIPANEKICFRNSKQIGADSIDGFLVPYSYPVRADRGSPRSPQSFSWPRLTLIDLSHFGRLPCGASYHWGRSLPLSNLRCTNLILLTLMSILILSVTLNLAAQAPASNQASASPPKVAINTDDDINSSRFNLRKPCLRYVRHDGRGSPAGDQD